MIFLAKLFANKLVGDEVFHFIDHPTDAIVVFMNFAFANAAKAKTFNNFADLLRLTDQAARLFYNDLCHLFHALL
jgi:hypothetical protein